MLTVAANILLWLLLVKVELMRACLQRSRLQCLDACCIDIDGSM